jgi:hypothetical protein
VLEDLAMQMLLNVSFATSSTANRDLRGVAGVVLVLSVSALILMEIVVAISQRIEQHDIGQDSSTRSGIAWLRFVHGRGLRVFRRRTVVIAAVSGVVTLVAFLS